MKFVCGECQAKYQIPDERVAGRKLKIRCRKCGAAIHLRGEHASAVGEPAPDIEWHVAIDGEQHGPYPTGQMGSMLRDGELDWEASVWRDGYADWKTADESDTLVRAVAAVAETRHSAPPSFPHEGRSSSPSIVPEYDDEGPTRMVHNGLPDEELPTRMVHNAPPADEHQPYASSVVATRARSVSPAAGIAPVRRAASVSPVAGIAPVQPRAASVAPIMAVVPARAPVSIAPVRAPAPAAVHVPPPVPVRTEDLSYAVAKLSASSAPDSMRPGYAGGEGSGLIDIRALAALTQTGHSKAAPMPVARGNGRSGAPSDVLVPLGAPSSPFGNIDSLAPFERQQSRSKALPIAIVAGSSMIAAAAFLAVFLTRKEAAATVADAEPSVPAVVVAAAALPTPSEEATLVAAAPSGERLEPVAAAAALAAVVEAEEPAEAEQPEADEPEPSRGASPRVLGRMAGKAKGGKAAKPSKGGGGAANKAKAVADEKDDDLLAAPAEAPAVPAPAAGKSSIDDLMAGGDKAAPAATEAPKPKAAPAGNRSIDELLDGAVVKKGGGAAATAGPAGGGANLPETPSRDDVLGAMRSVEPEVQACAAGQTLDTPSTNVAITVNGSTGRVQAVRVTGNQGAVGSCIARVVRGARFPQFSKPQFAINFPYKLR